MYLVKTDQVPKVQEEEIEEGKFIPIDELSLWVHKSLEDFSHDSLCMFVKFKNDYLSGPICKSGVIGQ